MEHFSNHWFSFGGQNIVPDHATLYDVSLLLGSVHRYNHSIVGKLFDAVV